MAMTPTRRGDEGDDGREAQAAYHEILHVVITVQGTNLPDHAKIYGESPEGVTPDFDCSAEDITPHRSF
jgi:hypothetical protein